MSSLFQAPTTSGKWGSGVRESVSQTALCKPILSHDVSPSAIILVTSQILLDILDKQYAGVDVY